MDIDEFLDKEIEKESSQGEQSESEEKPESQPEAKEERPAEKGKPDEEAPSEANKGEDSKGGEDRLSKLEKEYHDLWHRLSGKTFNWDKSLYAETKGLGEEINASLQSEKENVEQKKNWVREAMRNTLKNLHEGDEEAALNQYSKIIGLKSTIPKAFFKEIKEIDKEALELYSKLKSSIDNKHIKHFEEAAREIKNELRKAFSAINVGRVAEAKKHYEEAVLNFKNLPMGFLQQKTTLGRDLLELYKDLSIHAQIKELESQLNNYKPGVAHTHMPLQAKSQPPEETFANLSRMAHNKDSGAKEIQSKRKAQRAEKAPVQEKKDKEKSSLFDLRKIIARHTHHSQKEHHSLSHLKDAIAKHKEEKPSSRLLKKLVGRKIERAKSNMENGFYEQARHDLESALRLDPKNAEAKKVLNKIPA